MYPAPTNTVFQTVTPKNEAIEYLVKSIFIIPAGIEITVLIIGISLLKKYHNNLCAGLTQMCGLWQVHASGIYSDTFLRRHFHHMRLKNIISSFQVLRRQQK